MIECVVTDRTRLAPGAPFDEVRRRFAVFVRRAVAAHIDYIQIRESDLDAARLLMLVEDAVNAARGSATRVLVSDRADVALAGGADGVHLPGRAVPASAVRAMVPPEFVIGRSVHTPAEALAAGPVDFLIAGTTYASVSKPAGTNWLGPEGLAAIVRAASVPVLAIGGIGPERVPEVLRTGAAGVAAIGMYLERFDSLDGAS